MELLSTRRRAEWLTKINRKNWRPHPNTYVCSACFVHGRPTNLIDDTNPDWVPSVAMGYTTKEGDFNRYDHHRRRQESCNDNYRPNNVGLTDSSAHVDDVPVDSSSIPVYSSTPVGDVPVDSSSIPVDDVHVNNDLNLEDELTCLIQSKATR